MFLILINTLFQLFVPVINKLNNYCLHEILLQYMLDMLADKYKKLIILNQFTYHMYSQSKTVRWVGLLKSYHYTQRSLV